MLGVTSPTIYAGQCVDGLLGTLYHRNPLLLGYLDVSIGYLATQAADANQAEAGYCGMMMGATSAMQALPSNAIRVYPYDGQKGLLNTFSEAPDPAPDVARKGLPVSVFFGVTNYKVTKFTLRREGATSDEDAYIKAAFVASAPVANVQADPLMPVNSVALLPKEELQCGATYVAHIEGVTNGKAFVKEWKFTIAALYDPATWVRRTPACFQHA